ncbi:hypothetical protein [Thalassotalea sp. PS06]|uniref:hypothetical protein n=1 Tax=Thalassotalea sp. PS06 TaxID=2594005 RepID=UPI001162B0FC|nr:hypothetical protein [Thalassotalea sp. PS06]QDP01437.1 hypothetical protein FNC98_08900 [Thalassotalea sp. PS06]
MIIKALLKLLLISLFLTPALGVHKATAADKASETEKTKAQVSMPWYTHSQNDWAWIQYRDHPETGFVQIKANLTLNAKLKRVRYLLTDKTAALTWVEGVKRIVVLEQQQGSRVQLVVLDPIWPVEPREMLTSNTIRESDDEFMIEVEDHNQYLKPNPNRIRVEQVNVTWQVKQTEDNIVDVQYRGYFQPGGSLPAWLSNEIFLILISDSLANLKGVVEGTQVAQSNISDSSKTSPTP